MNSRQLKLQSSVAALALLVLAFCLNGSVAGAGRAPAGGPDFAAIDAYVQGQVKDLNLPGLALAVVHGNRIAHFKSFGVADPSGRPITAQTPFLLASVSKSFTALAIWVLRQPRRLHGDSPPHSQVLARQIPSARRSNESKHNR